MIKLPSLSSMTIESFIEAFHNILQWKKATGRRAYYDNPDREVLRAQAQFYAEPYANGSLGWSSNIWSRSKDNTQVVDDNSQLDDQHKLLMRSVLEYVLAPNPLIKTDGVLGEHPDVAFHCRIWSDARYPDLPLRWRELTFPADTSAKPDMEALMLPGMWTPAVVPGTGGKNPLFTIRFPEHWFTVGTVSSYQGEWKKSCLAHWIYHVYRRGGTGVHAGSRQLTVKDVDGQWKRIGMVIWGLTGSGKSTHGMYVFGPDNAEYYKEHGLDVLNLVKEQYVKNDDIVGLFTEAVRGSERGAWTKTEGVGPSQTAIYKAGMSVRALHENTGKDARGYPDFLDELLQYRGLSNRNARTVMHLEDVAPNFDGSVDMPFAANMAVFISPGYLTDYAWLMIMDANYAGAVLAAGRTVGHPAQGSEGIGEEKYVALYNPFIIGRGASPADHVHRFRDIKLQRDQIARETGGDPLSCYLVNTTGTVGSRYTLHDGAAGTVFEEGNGKKKPVGGTGPKIEETEIFLLQAARGAVSYRPHPFWGERVLVPTLVPGISPERLSELDPFHYRTEEEMRKLLQLQIAHSKKVFDTQVPGLDKAIYHAMDF